ncbi:MAG: hypothetical protein NVSMB55_21450 [Mycobacteriales bacterium]
MRLARKLFATTGAIALTSLALGASPASAATPAGGFADAKGIIVDLTVLTAVPLPGSLGNTPLDPNTFSRASQSCPPQVDKPAMDTFPGNVNAAPAVTAKTLNTMAGANCSAPDAVASAETEGVTALINAGVPTITADVIRAQANSDCTSAPNAKGSLFQNVKIAGTTVLPDPAPNTVIEIPGVAKVIVNEQHPTADGRGIVVNGLHIIGESPLLRGDLIISHATSGVVCPNGAGSDFSGVPGTSPEFTFAKTATPSTAQPGADVTYNATVTNKGKSTCDVISFTDHLAPGLGFTSTSGAFGPMAVSPLPKRGDGGLDVTFKPAAGKVSIAPGKSVDQQIVVKLAGDIKPGTYYNTLELFCNAAGNFASGPLAPVTVPAPAVVAPAKAAPLAKAPAAPAQLPRTGGAPLVAAAGLLLLVGAAGVRRSMTR